MICKQIHFNKHNNRITYGGQRGGPNSLRLLLSHGCLPISGHKDTQAETQGESLADSLLCTPELPFPHTYGAHSFVPPLV